MNFPNSLPENNVQGTFQNPAVINFQNAQRSYHNFTAWNIQNYAQKIQNSETINHVNQIGLSFHSPASINIQSAPRALHNQAQNLQPIHSSIVPPTNSCEANHVRLRLKAQAQLQTQQIDSAIQLLKMQYDAIMLSVHRASQSFFSVPTAQPSCCNAAAARDQASFAAQFELPPTAKSGIEYVRSSLSMETKVGSKRALVDSASAADISIGNLLAISESTDRSSQGKKRARWE